jgi:hypothetical protein
MKKNSLFFGLIVVLFVSSMMTGLLRATVPEWERDALIALYNSTGGDDWTDNSGWKKSPLHSDGFAMPGTENDWYGVEVSGGHVSVINLTDNQLSGSIPAELGDLGSLFLLYLNKNPSLGGSIPGELGKLGKLTTLALEQCQLSGGIPSQLGNLTKLEWLFLYSNMLTGEIPSSLANLTNLTPNVTNIEYNGLYTYDSTLRAFLDSQNPGWEDNQTTAPSYLSTTTLSNSSIRVAWTPIGYSGNDGGYKVYYGTMSGGPWTYAGMTAAKTASSYDITGLSTGTTYYIAIKTQTDPHSYNQNTVLSAYSEETTGETSWLAEKDPPFGSFDTPIEGSTVSSSIPVTGWALDDSGVDHVKLYRENGSSLVYIGDAALVEGARPDVPLSYPDYPNNTRAGWGYMMLTNFLPNGGNGTYVLHAVATDFAGKSTTLGTKTITCDNANAVKPFGAIDTPSQGGTASGSGFINWGWVLTPQPNYIPTDGSTINVFVDGVKLGHPYYNIYRSDIATNFPGYANYDGAIGYFYLDTTAYENGVHTIHWTATDSGQNTDGIGSRYFTIRNAGNRSRATASSADLSGIPAETSKPLGVKRIYRRNSEREDIYPGDKGFVTIEIKELERVEIWLSTPQDDLKGCSGYMMAGGQLKPLPTGSTLDAARGVFCWHPGPGYFGEYQLVFINEMQNGKLERKNMKIIIQPKF